MAETQPRTILDLPDLPANGELTSIKLAFVVPEASINYFKNPSSEVTNFVSAAQQTPLIYGNSTTLPAGPVYAGPSGSGATYIKEPAYGRTSAVLFPTGAYPTGVLMLPLPDGTSDARLGLLNAVNSQSSVSFEVSGKAGEILTASVEAPYIVDFFNRSGTFNGSIDDLGINTWISPDNYALSGAAGTVTLSSSFTQNRAWINNLNTSDLVGSVSVDFQGVYSGSSSFAAPGFMYRYDTATQNWLGFRLDYNGLKLMTGKVGTPGSDVILATGAFSPVTGIPYNITMVVSQVGTNYNFLLSVGGTQVINYTTSIASLFSYNYNYLGLVDSVTGTPSGTMSWDNLIVSDPSFVYASKTVRLTPDWQRLSLTFPYEYALTSHVFPKPAFYRQALFLRKNGSLNVFYSDGFQYENKSYSTTYFDGDFGGTWEGLRNSSTSSRSQAQGGGRVVSLDSLSCRVTGLVGFGMNPVANKTVPQAQTGNESYQRTVGVKAVRSIVCCIYGENQLDLMYKTRKLEALIAPDAITAVGKNLKIQFQVYEPNTNLPAGPVLETFVKYLGGLEGNINNDWQFKFVLQLESYVTPGIYEVYSKQATLPTNVASITMPAWYRANSQWKPYTAAAVAAYSAYLDLQGAAWYGWSGGNIGRTFFDRNTYATGSVTGAGLAVNAFLMTADQRVYAAGSFTSPAAYIMSQASGAGAWSQVGPSTWNNTINALAVLNDGRVLIGGLFTLPVSYMAIYNPALTTVTVLGALDNQVRCFAVVPGGGGFYFGGGFNVSGATTLTRIGYYNLTNNVISALTTSLGTGLNGAARAMVVDSRGVLYIGGDFTTAGGAAVQYIASWNGQNFAVVGDGLNGVVYGLKIGPDGFLYAVGQFTATQSGRALTPGIAKINIASGGGVWLPVDINHVSSGMTITAIDMDARTTVTATSVMGGDTAYPASNMTVNYTGGAGVNPKIIFDNSLGTATVQLFQLSNVTTGKTLYFNYTVAIGEVLTLDVSVTGVTLTSSYGPQNNRLLPGSDSGAFGLQPGSNFLTFTTGPQNSQFTAYMLWKNQHWSFNGGVYNVGNL